MKILGKSIIILLYVFLSGCVYLVPPKEKPVVEKFDRSPDFLHYSAKSMTLYGGYIAGLSSFERIIECEKLMSGEAGDISSLSIRLHTAFISMLTPECGGPKKALKIFDSVRDKVSQKDLKNLISYQYALANRLVARNEQEDVLQKQVDELQTRRDALKRQLAARDTELSQLKATLDALKKIEKTFHQRNDAGVP